MLSLRGELVVVGKSPDGDSIRFIPRSPALLRSLEGGARVDPSSDGSVQLRLDAIDAPETHYNGLAQPLAEPARAELLAWCGFTDVRWSGEQVSAATPERVDPVEPQLDRAVGGRIDSFPALKRPQQRR